MKNKNILTWTIILAFVSLIIYYLLLKDIICIGFLTVITAASLYRFIIPSFLKTSTKLANLDFTHRFINSLLIELSINSSVYEAILRVKEYLNEPILNSLDFDQSNYLELLTKLGEKLSIHSYDVFLSVIKTHDSEGGDLLNLNYTLLNDLDIIKVKTDYLSKMKKRKLFDYIVMWTTFFLILFYIRFGLTTFYEYVLVTPLFSISLTLLFIIFNLCNIFFFIKYSQISLEEGGKI